MQDPAGAMECVYVGKLASGTQVFDWKHKSVDDCISALGSELRLLLEREARAAG